MTAGSAGAEYPFGRFERALPGWPVEPMDPRGIEIQEVEDDVADIRHREYDDSPDINSSTRLNTRSVHIARVGAPLWLTCERYLGSQPSTEAW